ncbi:hypothetical protein L1887_47936 [Cichorium endivia]|nr:hypothetical protein L1887_47936 [Cichorium endivia]
MPVAHPHPHPRDVRKGRVEWLCMPAPPDSVRARAKSLSHPPHQPRPLDGAVFQMASYLGIIYQPPGQKSATSSSSSSQSTNDCTPEHRATGQPPKSSGSGCQPKRRGPSVRRWEAWNSTATAAHESHFSRLDPRSTTPRTGWLVFLALELVVADCKRELIA